MVILSLIVVCAILLKVASKPVLQPIRIKNERPVDRRR